MTSREKAQKKECNDGREKGQMERRERKNGEKKRWEGIGQNENA